MDLFSPEGCVACWLGAWLWSWLEWGPTVDYLCDLAHCLTFRSPELPLLYLIFISTALGLPCDAQTLHCCMKAFSNCCSWTCIVAMHQLEACRHSNPGTRAYRLPHGMWDLNPPTRDQTHIPCIGRHILNHWTTREVPSFSFYNCKVERITISTSSR